MLAEFKLTPKEYKLRFDTATKSANETYVLFASRLHNLLTYYLSSRDVNDLDTLCKLLVSDKLKTTLPPGILNYVLSLEGDEWFEASRVAGLADTYAANHDSRSGQSQPSGQKSFNGNSARHAPYHPRDTNVSLSPRTYGRGRGNYGPSQPGRGRGYGDRNQGERRCFYCHAAVSYTHLTLPTNREV